MEAQPVKASAVLHAQAVGHFRAGRMAQGIALLEKALALDPGSGEIHSHLGIALFQTGDAERAGRHFGKAVRLSPGKPDIQNDYGAFLLETDRPAEAESLFRRALALKPDYAEALFGLGRCLERQGRFGEAESRYLAAIRLRPRWLDALHHAGLLYMRMDQPEHHDQALRCFEKVLSIDPRHEQAWIGLVRAHEKKGDRAAEEEALGRAEKQFPHSLELAVIRMTILMRQEKRDGVARVLGRVSQKLKEPAALHHAALRELAMVYDEMGDPAAAMRWFRESGEAQKKTHAARRISRDAFPAKIEGYRTALAASGKWRAAPPLADDSPCPVFLVGFPRSGTTLLDQIFSGHPAVETAEEKPAIRAAEISISGPGKAPAWTLLDKIDDAGIEAARAAYFSAMRKSGCALKPGHVFIDKLPLNLVHAPVIRRLFPEARFILALRHPCDCVLSNYMQSFIPNEGMISMLDLNDAARFYDRCFAAWEDAVRVLSLSFHAVKYEDVVTDLKTEIVKALDFLGLEWQDSLAAFDETAKARHIKTPSRTQVTRKIYTRARGRWRKYREHMGEAPETLRPWIEKFGYETGE